MKKVILLGSSVASVKAVEILKAKGEYEFTLFAFDGFLPYKRELVPAYLAKEIQSAKVLYQPKDYYSGINVLYDKKISRININRKRITTEDKEQFDFDYLIVGDMPAVKYPDIKGVNKTGIYNLSKFHSVNQLFENIPFFDNAVIQSDSLYGLETALALSKHHKEILLVSSKNSQLSRIFLDEGLRQLQQMLAEMNIQFLADESIAEVLGESDVKAVRVLSGKVYAAQAVIYENVSDNYKLLAESGLNITEAIGVDRNFSVGAEGVYAVDHVCFHQESSWDKDFPKNTQYLCEEGVKLAKSMLNEDYQMKEIPVVHSFGSDKCVMDVIGYIREGVGIETHKTAGLSRNMFQKFYIREGILVGACQVNVHGLKDKIVSDIASSVRWNPLNYAVSSSIQPAGEIIEQKIEDNADNPASVNLGAESAG